MKCPPLHVFFLFGDWIFFMATILQLKVAKRQAWRRAWSAVGALLCYMHFIQVTNPFISWFLLFFFPTEQLAPTKEAILQIESNEFVPQSFSSSAGSKDQQVTKILFNLFYQELFWAKKAVWKTFWIKTRAWLTQQQVFHCLPYPNCFTVPAQFITNFLLTLIFDAHFFMKFVIV